MPGKGFHVIENYSVSKNTIECVCGWFGDAGVDWTQHKREMKGIKVEIKDKKIPSQIPF